MPFHPTIVRRLVGGSSASNWTRQSGRCTIEDVSYNAGQLHRYIGRNSDRQEEIEATLNSVLAMHDQGPVSMRRLICLKAGKDLRPLAPRNWFQERSSMIIGAFACQKYAPARLRFSFVASSFGRVFVVRECIEGIQPIKESRRKAYII